MGTPDLADWLHFWKLKHGSKGEGFDPAIHLKVRHKQHWTPDRGPGEPPSSLAAWNPQQLHSVLQEDSPSATHWFVWCPEICPTGGLPERDTLVCLVSRYLPYRRITRAQHIIRCPANCAEDPVCSQASTRWSESGRSGLVWCPPAGAILGLPTSSPLCTANTSCDGLT